MGSQSQRPAPVTSEAGPESSGPSTSPVVSPDVGGGSGGTGGTAAPSTISQSGNIPQGPDQRTGVSFWDLAIIGAAILAGETDRLRDHMDHIDPILTWVVDHGGASIVVSLAGGIFSQQIVAAVNRTGTFDRIVAGCTVSGQTQHQGLFALIGDATTRTRAQLDACLPKLFPSTRILHAGEVPVLAFGSGVPAYTDSSVTPNRQYTFAKRAVSVDPTDAAMAMFFNIMRNVPRNGLAATHTLQFAAEEEHFWWQTGVSPEWRPWAPPIRRPIPTSYAGAGHVVLEAKAGGTTQLETARAVDGTISATGNTITNLTGDVSQNHVGSDAEGTATAVGGGEDRTASGGTDQRTAPNGLVYFQNHAIHEFGHSVGAAKYTNVATTGNQFAENYGTWRKKTPAEFKTAMWNATDGDTFTDPAGGTTAVTADAVADWMVGCISGGAEPSGNVVTGITASFAQKSAMIQASAKYGGQELTKYFVSVSGGGVGGIPGGAYQYTGYTPAGDPHFFASRWDNSFASISRACYDTCKPRLGWYSMASPAENFAEAYTIKYAGGAVPASLGSGRDYADFFSQLERSPSIETAAGANLGVAGAAAPMAGGEVAPPTTVIP